MALTASWRSWFTTKRLEFCKDLMRCLASHCFKSAEADRHWQVSSYGRVCNMRGVISSGSIKASGYSKVSIAGKDLFVHRVVAFVFFGPPPSHQTWQVHHRDGNPSNNRVENLEYTTPSQNTRYSYSNPSRRTCGPGQSIPVMWRPVGSQSWTTSPSIKQTAAELGISTWSVRNGCFRGKTSKGYEFQHANWNEVATLDGEEWRQMYDPMSGVPVVGRFVSSLGRIKAQNGRTSRGSQTKAGYYATQLSLKSLQRHELVHRLVAFAFLGPPMDHQRSHVNHKDRDKGNNSVDNLEYVTPAENNAHYFVNGGRRPRWDGKPVESSLGAGDSWTWHSSISSAANALGVPRVSVRQCAYTGRKHIGGFEFRFAQPVASEVIEGEEWRKVNIEALLLERALRHQR